MKTISLLVLAVLLVACAAKDKTQPQPPLNVLFIMTDDHATKAMSAYGSVLNQTPHLDRIAQQGMRFDRAYCTNSICAPSRAVILTGKHSHINGVLNNAQTFDGSQHTLPKSFQEAGYATALIGKWHLKSDPTGFDYWIRLPGQGLYYNPVFIEMGERQEHKGYVTDLVTDFALDWLKKRDTEQPFFLMLQHKAPHRNWMPNTEHLSLYQDIDLPEPDNLFDNYAGRTAAAEQEMTIAQHMSMAYDLKVHELDSIAPDWQKGFMPERLSVMSEAQRTAWLTAYEPENRAMLEANLQGKDLVRWKYQRYIKDYLRCIQSVDDNVGRVLDYLEASGLAQNTLVIYTSDQGFYLGEHGWYDKRFMYEESYRMPLLMQLPGVIPASTHSDALLMNIDFAPTMLDLAGLPIPADMQGTSFAELARTAEKPADWRSANYYHYFEYPGVHAVKRHYGIRTDRYKLIHFYHDIDSWELYDLESDPDEMHNRYDDPAFAEIQSRLQQELRELQVQYQDQPAQFMPDLNQQSKDHLAVGASINFARAPHPRYRKASDTRLTDGRYWSYSLYQSLPLDTWLGYNEQDPHFTIDLGGEKKVQSIGLNCYQNPDSWIYFPTEMDLWLAKEDGDFFRVHQEALEHTGTPTEGIELFTAGFDPVSIRYIQVRAKRQESIPKGMPGEGKNAWLFLDEVIVQ